jgi:probable rRNA maturation factor
MSGQAVQDVVEAVLLFEEKAADSVTVYFVSDAKMRKYHKVFFKDASPTDCISLPLDSDYSLHLPFRHLGDILICPNTAHNYVKNDNSLFWRELTLYLVHSLLHLLGFDDTTKLLKEQMRKEERRAMRQLVKKGLLLTGTFRSSNRQKQS